MRMFNDQARIMIGGRKSSKGGIDSAFHGTISGRFSSDSVVNMICIEFFMQIMTSQ